MKPLLAQNKDDASYDTELLIQHHNDPTSLDYGDAIVREVARRFLEEKYGAKFARQFDHSTRPHRRSIERKGNNHGLKIA